MILSPISKMNLSIHIPSLPRTLLALVLFTSAQPLIGQEAATAAERRADIEVSVVASRTEQPTLETAGSTSTIDAEKLRRQGAVSLGDALKYEPGVSVPFDFSGGDGLVPYLSGGDQGINIRGLEGNRVSLRVDGIRQPEDFVAQSFLGAGGPGRIYFDPAVLNQVEILKSASSSLYGSDALGGTVDARTFGPAVALGASLQGQSLSNTLSYASVNDSFHNRFTGASGDGQFAAGLVYSYRTGNERRNNGDADPNPEDFTSHAIVLSTAFQSAIWRLEAVVDVFRYENFVRAHAAEGSFFGGMLVNDLVTQEEERERDRLSLRGHYTPATGNALFDGLDIHGYWQDSTASSYNIQQGSTQFGPVPVPRDRHNDIRYKTRIRGVDVQADKLVSLNQSLHEWVYGIELSQSDIESQFLRTDYNPDGSTTVDDRIGMAPSEVLRMGAFARNAISWGPDERWVFTGGLRLDHYDVSPENTDAFLDRTQVPGSGESVSAVDYKNTALAPSLSLLHRWTPSLNGYLSYNRGIRNPSAEELNGVFTHGTDFIVVPNPDLKEETSDSFELGIQGATTHNTFQLAGYYNFYDDFLESLVVVESTPDPDPDVLTTVNRREVEIYGVELRWDARIDASLVGFEGLETGLSYAWTKGKRTDVNLPLNSVEPWKLVGYFGYRAPADLWSLRLTGSYIGKKSESSIDHTTDAGAIDPVDSVLLLDLTASMRFGQHWRLNAGVNNLTDESYYLWSTARRGGGHGGAGADRNTQPGRNAFISLSASF